MAISEDPRPLFRRALAQVEEHVRTVRACEMGLSTPCADFDVRALLGHLVAVVDKLTRLPAGGDPAEVTDPTTGVDDADWAGRFADARGELERQWSADTSLTRTYRLPWATMLGHEVLTAYTHEFTAHSWDLAYALGRDDVLDEDLAVAALDWFAHHVPADARAGHGKFGDPLPAPENANGYQRLAAFLGRRPDLIRRS